MVPGVGGGAQCYDRAIRDTVSGGDIAICHISMAVQRTPTRFGSLIKKNTNASALRCVPCSASGRLRGKVCTTSTLTFMIILGNHAHILYCHSEAI